MKNYQFAIFGANGKVGKELFKSIKKSSDLSPFLAKDSELVVDDYLHKNKTISEDIWKNVDVVIDFSGPQGTEEAVKVCKEFKLPLVSGTTGLNQNHFEAFKELAETSPVFWAPNMSLGIAILKKALSVFEHFNEFDFQIEEFHHVFKKDAPSGTALLLQGELEKVVQKKIASPLSIRGGGFFGVHKVYAMRQEEVLCFEHSALNREVFAKGALVAARWIVNKQKGYYSMEDLLK